MRYFLWMSTVEPGYCVLDSTRIKNVKNLHIGMSVADTFPTDISYQMSDMFPDDIMLSDNYEVAGQIIVSENLKSFLQQSLQKHHIEYLPVSILNHKGRVASADYTILHPLDVCDCIDIENSGIEWSPLDPTKVLSCKSLLLKVEAIPTGLSLFRLKHWGSNILASADLVDSLLARGFVGLRFIDPTGYTGIG